MKNVEQKMEDIKIPINWSHEFHIVCVCVCVQAVCAMYYLNQSPLLLPLSFCACMQTII